MVATMTGLTTTMTSIFGPIIASPSAAVTSAAGAPRRTGQSTRRAPAPRTRKAATETASAARFECTIDIGIRAGFIPMYITM